ncbi:MAG: homoserine dehydrogenase [Gammaproteobacteria bacterium]|nr:homoserine dehydrogenase [Gammaproteobacteria bacterium]
MQRLNILLLGFGHVGRAFAALVRERQPEFLALGLDLRLTGIVARHASLFDAAGLDLARLTAQVPGQSLDSLPRGLSELRGLNAQQLLARGDIDLVVELTPTDLATAQPALDHISWALKRGLAVVTANKGPSARYGAELDALKAAHGGSLGLEGTVLGGTPLLHLARGALAGQTVLRLRGILNGTSNYILSQMEQGLSFDAALADAQVRGYAEAEPSADVDGWDTLAKTAILAQQFFGEALEIDLVPVQGIRALTPADIAGAKARGERWKLIAEIRREDGVLSARIAPQCLAESESLAGVGGVNNAVCIDTDCLAGFTISGPGAGPRETASAVLADVLRLAGELAQEALFRKRA